MAELEPLLIKYLQEIADQQDMPSRKPLEDIAKTVMLDVKRIEGESLDTYFYRVSNVVREAYEARKE